MAAKCAVEAFECDPDFCPECGSILPLPGLEDVVSCRICDFQKDTTGTVKDILNILAKSDKIFTCFYM
jgi:hypothetical protein